MSLSIVDYELPDETHNLYDVNFFTTRIHTLVTQTPSFVTEWISQFQPTTPLIVGLDVEWRPNFARNSDNPIATLQLCTGPHCLVFQILHAPSVPTSLSAFLNNPLYKFVGVGIESDVEKLICDYGLSVANFVDICGLAAEVYGARELKSAGLKVLAQRVLGKELVKPKRVTMSRWDNPWLTPAQVQYACIDAFLSFEIGRTCLSAAAI
ncbi:hypothetical protein RJ639_043681 [Escallonia herrerae]|uniref:3'-5' exonuclease domain-containing protein n=1 Tax=Escallonia herrerae TaxID=1293975 RepID=A0AA88WF74_9ASTE|nr:hypothetical protein RJ639_043681 [Escallonia herrerae]